MKKSKTKKNRRPRKTKKIKTALYPLLNDSSNPFKRPKIQRYSVCDIEASKWNIFITIGHFDGKNFRHFEKLSDFLEYILTQPDDLIFAHYGGGYDFHFILQAILDLPTDPDNDVTFTVENIILQGSTMLCMDYCLYVKGREARRIKFSDSKALLQQGLEKLTHGFDVEHKKLTDSVDYTKFKKATKKLIRYLEHDCRGLYEVLEKFYQWPTVKKAGSALTTASQALKIFRLYLKDPLYPLKDDDDAFVRKGYSGGRVEIFKVYYKSDTTPLNYYDVSSLYPFVMSNNDIPGEFSHETDVVDPEEMSMLHAKVEVPKGTYLPFLGTKYKKKFIFPTGVFKGYWTNRELLYAESLGVKILEIYEGRAFKNRGRLFEEFILDHWKIRQDPNSSYAANQIAKLIMNALSGRFALRHDREEIVIDDLTKCLETWREVPLKDGSVVRFSKKPKWVKTFSNPMISAWITALGRIHMHKIMNSLGEDLYYTDTDSFFTTKTFETNNELGGLKLVKKARFAVFLLPKSYSLEYWDQDQEISHETVIKGFDKKKIQALTPDDFYNAFTTKDFSKLTAESEARGLAKFRSALKSGSFLTLQKAIRKEVQSEYDKRIPIGEGNTRPIHVRLKKR